MAYILEEAMILNNVTTINSNGPVNIQLKNGQIIPADKHAVSELQLNFTDAIAFPGLVNWHDHLDFNLFPQLGDRVYNNYTEWGSYIHANYKDEIAAVLKVPLDLRVNWGIFKNLLCGVTTVVNHGEQLDIVNAPINVEQCHSIHSVQFEKLWKIKLNNPFKRKVPAVIHVGEGSDKSSKNEIDQLLNWNLINKKLIGIHGVAMSPSQAKKFEALVWCPESNYFLLNKTAPANHLKKYTTILFGTDSTLTGDWNIWDHIRLARKTNMLTDAELYDSLHSGSTAGKKTNNGTIVVAKKEEGQSAFDSFYGTDPAAILLVVHANEIRLFDDSMLGQLKHLNLDRYSKISVNGAHKYVQGDLPGLIKQVKSYYPAANFPVTAN
ncbi:hypothetical protein FO440_03110 [Mucilaginibacter corticis]|uniref:Amidohydrolase family protein n=1 Tax=Mucilaginibacter corticis TaxID=2597670 RepID=A0A556MTI7_9SPHI|nr:hypothetical protein [Mucilaginibacter corticis]TSJ43195.1 hypothetical protein FO440_03110 [Mucilaginibacter corticis]